MNKINQPNTRLTRHEVFMDGAIVHVVIYGQVDGSNDEIEITRHIKDCFGMEPNDVVSMVMNIKKDTTDNVISVLHMSRLDS